MAHEVYDIESATGTGFTSENPRQPQAGQFRKSYRESETPLAPERGFTRKSPGRSGPLEQ